jgi:hypothetical protein
MANNEYVCVWRILMVVMCIIINSQLLIVM